MSPKNKKNLEAAINNLFSSPPVAGPGAPVMAEPALAVLASLPEKDNSRRNGLGAGQIPAPRPADPPVTAAPIAEEMKTPDPNSGDTPPIADRKDQDGLQMVIFTLHGQYYGIDIAEVESIIKMQSITRLPQVARYTIGLTNLRGKVLPVFSLRRRFGLPDQEENKDSRIVVIRLERGEAGLLVDSVSEVSTILRENIAPAPDIATSSANRYIQGIARLEDRLVILPDLNRMIEAAE